MRRGNFLLCMLAVATAAQAQPLRVAVLPFQALSGELPPQAGPRITARLTAELGLAEGLALAEPAAPPEPEEGLERARAAVAEAQALRQALQLARAEAALEQALALYRAHAGEVRDAGEVADAYALRSAVQYATGRDEEAEQSLSLALSLVPGRPLPLAATSPLFARTVEQVRRGLESLPRSTLRFTSVPPGVPVSLAGRRVGTAPLRVAGVPPGAHLWRAQLPSGEYVGGLVEVDPGKEAQAAIQPAGTGPGVRLALALAGNRVDKEGVEDGKALARAAGAEALVFGMVSRRAQGLVLEAFLLALEAEAPRRLPAVPLDSELLEAGPPLRELASLLASRKLEAGAPLKLPAMSTAVPPAPRLGETSYPTAFSQGVLAPEPQQESKPLPTRKPLLPP